MLSRWDKSSQAEKLRSGFSYKWKAAVNHKLVRHQKAAKSALWASRDLGWGRAGPAGTGWRRMRSTSGTLKGFPGTQPGSDLSAAGGQLRGLQTVPGAGVALQADCWAGHTGIPWNSTRTNVVSWAPGYSISTSGDCQDECQLCWKQPGLVGTTLKSHFKEEMTISTQSCNNEVTSKKWH